MSSDLKDVSETERRRNIVDVLAHLGPERGVTFVQDGNHEKLIQYDQLAELANRYAHHLLERDSRHQTPVIIALDQPEAFVKAFWGAMVAGHIPVPLKLPNSAETRLKLLLVFQQCRQALWISSGFDRELYQEVAEKHGLTETLNALEQTYIDYNDLDQLPALRTGQARQSKPILDTDLAFIQFSSGSTGTPKGVMITHRQLMIHLRDWQETSCLIPEDRFLSWFPLTHDMGLIGWHLLPVFMNADHCLMPTKLFVVRPSLWMAKTSTYRANILCTNNFGLKHFLKLTKPEHKDDWDLTAVRLLFNAAEPISSEVCEEFGSFMQGTGLAAHVMYPGYGLAEATLGVSFPLPGEPVKVHILDRRYLGVGDRIQACLDSSSAVSIVEIGRRMTYGRFRIADLSGQVLPDFHVGEIQFQSESATPGYYFDSQASDGLFTEDGWVKTGDLGFVINDRLTVTGRLKEILIQAGVNYYPQDLERVAQQVEGVELGKVVACSVPIYQSQQELIVIFLVHKGAVSDFKPLANAVKSHVTREVGCVVDFVVPIRSVPKTTSGKIQRVSLAKRFQAGEFDDLIQEMQACKSGSSSSGSPTQVEPETPFAVKAAQDATLFSQHDLIKTIFGVCNELGLQSLSPDISLFEQGLDSRKSIEFVFALERQLQRSLPASLPFDYPTAQAIAMYLQTRKDVSSIVHQPTGRVDEPVAVIGMSCRMPGGIDSPGALWNALVQGVDVVNGMPASRGNTALMGGFLEDVAGFDHRFYNISTREAQGLDPQARLTLELVWEALEHAGIDPALLRAREVATCVGVSNVDYAGAQFRSGVDQRMDTYSYTGIANPMIAGRVAHLFDFTGPAMSIDTACSSSLVAVDMAVKALRSGDCELAIAGGVNLVLTAHGHDCLTMMGALSPTGKCRPFSAQADGYIRSEGAGFIVLKPLSKALRDQDTIWAVIGSTATNHDGHSSGLTVPNGPSQARLIRKAIQQAGLTPDDIAYLEAHGTGTPLGDPIELGALQQVFGNRPQGQKLLTGSVKGNIGHLESAAGIAGLLKAILIAHHRIAPASLHAGQLTEKVDWSELPVQVNQQPTPLTVSAKGCWVGVSSFGFAGTNAHAIVGMPSEMWAAHPAENNVGHVQARSYLFAISAKSTRAFEDQLRQWHRYLSQASSLEPAHLASLSTVHRAHFPHRAAVRFENLSELKSKLDQLKATRPRTDSRARVAFVFSGQGGQWAGMGMALYQHVPVFKDAMDRCDALFLKFAGVSVLEELAQSSAESSGKWLRTDLSQMAIFALQVAWTDLLNHLGIRAEGVVGHSCGEVAACWASGALPLEEAVKLIADRGRLMQQLASAGRMLAVRANHQTLGPRLPGGLSLASINSPTSCVVAGDEDQILLFKTQLENNRTSCRLIEGGFAFHTQAMQQAADALAKLAPAQIEPNHSVALYSTVLGARLTESVSGQDHWYRNVRDPVLYADAIQSMHEDGYTHYIEIGPHPVLLNNIAECISAKEQPALISSMRRGSGDEALLDVLAQCYEAGLSIDWMRLYPKVQMPMSGLPSYPWQRVQHWQEGFDPWMNNAAQSKTQPDSHLLWTTQPDVNTITVNELEMFSVERSKKHITWHVGAHGQPWPDWMTVDSNETVKSNDASIHSHHPHVHVYVSTANTLDRATAELEDAINLIGQLSQQAHRHQPYVPGRLVFVARQLDQGWHEGLFGLARVAENEHPELGIKRLLLKEIPNQITMPGLIHYLVSSQCHVSECQFDGSGLSAFRLAPGRTGGGEIQIHPDRVVLVTGGYGSLGRVMASALVRYGARKIVLVGRRVASEEALASKAFLESLGANVLLEQADVGVRADVLSLFERLSAQGLQIGGVVHAAGVLTDQLISQVDASRVRSSMSAKVDGAWFLHEFTQHLDLDFFVFISSFATTLGNPGQGVYAAANGLLDALSLNRKASGLPAVSVRLGLMDGSTMAARVKDRLALEGVRTLSLAWLEKHFVSFVGSSEAILQVADFTPELWYRAHPTNGVRHFLSRWVEDAQVDDSVSVSTDEARLLPVDLDLNQYLLDRVSAVTKTPINEIDADQPFWELGLDSMLTMQLRNQIAQDLGVDIHITTFWAYSTINRYADFLKQEIPAEDRSGNQSLDQSVDPEGDKMVPESDTLAGKWEKFL